MKQLEIYFRSLHGDNVSKAPNVFKTLTDKLQISTQDLKLPLDVLQCLIRKELYKTQQFKQSNLKKQKFTK